jgi:hypothetical protein
MNIHDYVKGFDIKRHCEHNPVIASASEAILWSQILKRKEKAQNLPRHCEKGIRNTLTAHHCELLYPLVAYHMYRHCEECSDEAIFRPSSDFVIVMMTKISVQIASLTLAMTREKVLVRTWFR